MVGIIFKDRQQQNCMLLRNGINFISSLRNSKAPQIKYNEDLLRLYCCFVVFPWIICSGSLGCPRLRVACILSLLFIYELPIQHIQLNCNVFEVSLYHILSCVCIHHIRSYSMVRSQLMKAELHCKEIRSWKCYRCNHISILNDCNKEPLTHGPSSV